MINPGLLPAGLANLFAGNMQGMGGFGAPAATDPIPQPSGLFGMKGNLRDILGTLGDTLLVGTGASNPIYTPQRDQERLGQAMQGFADNPLEAVKRMAGAGFGQEAREAYNDFVKQRVEKSKANAQIASQTATADNAKARTRNEVLDYESTVNQQIFNMLGAVDFNDPVKVQAAKDLAMQYAKNKGVELRIPMPDQLTPDYVRQGRESFVSPKERAQIEGLESYRDATTGIRREGQQDLRDYRQTRLGQIDRALNLDEGEFLMDMLEPDSKKTSSGSVTPQPPPRDPAKNKGKTLSGPGGVWTSDGKRWIRKQ